jgi:hypothetical protein
MKRDKNEREDRKEPGRDREADRQRDREEKKGKRKRESRTPRFVLHLLDGKCVNRRRTTNWLVGHESSP